MSNQILVDRKFRILRRKIGKAMDVEKRMKPGLETMEENVDNLVA